MDIRFVVNVKEKHLEAYLNGKRKHKILSAEHFREIQGVYPMSHIQDFVAYSNYLKSQGFWDVDIKGKTYEIIFKKTA